MIWHNYRRCSLMYRRTTSSSTLPTVSAKYPSAQEAMSPQKLFQLRILFSYHPTRSPFSLCTTSATLSLGFVWMIICTWSSSILSSLIHHLFIRHASYNNFLRRMTTLPRSTRRRIFRYPHQVVLQTVFRMGPRLVSSHSQIMSQFAPLRQVPPGSASKGCHSSPGLKAWGFPITGPRDASKDQVDLIHGDRLFQ